MAVPVTWLVQPTAVMSRAAVNATHGAGNSHVNPLPWCAEYPQTIRTLVPSARELCVSYPRMQPCRQPLVTRSWCARCDRRRVLPPECQRRHQLGASGDRASPPQRSRSPRHRPGHAARRAAGRPGPRRCPRSPGAVADVPEDHLAAARCAAAPNGRACYGDSTPTWCTSRRRHCSATADCTPHATSACRPSRYSKRTSRVSRQSYGIGVAARAAWAWTRHLHSRADRTLAPSTSAMENLAAHRIPRVHKWARGVDIAGFAPSARDEQLRRRWSPDGKPIVGFVGRLAPEKHVERLAVLARP